MIFNLDSDWFVIIIIRMQGIDYIQTIRLLFHNDKLATSLRSIYKAFFRNFPKNPLTFIQFMASLLWKLLYLSFQVSRPRLKNIQNKNSKNMKNFELIKQGAEAKLYKGIYLGQSTIAKERFIKNYRHPSLDTNLTKERIKAESRALMRCKIAGIRTPAIYLVDFKRRTIFMEYLEYSKTAKDFIEDYTKLGLIKELSQFFYEIGNLLGKLHENNIIHGDLTSSNILVVNKNNEHNYDSLSELDLVAIDFGLAHIESNTEYKGVDLYVLERALLSTHSVAEEIFPKILEGYKKQYKNGSREVFLKYEDVKARGRKRTMVG